MKENNKNKSFGYWYGEDDIDDDYDDNNNRRVGRILGEERKAGISLY